MKTICLHMLLWAIPAGGQIPALPATLNYDLVRRLIVQHDGRYMPLDTLARDVVEEVTGTPRFHNRDAVAWLLAWTFAPETWRRAPLLTIGNRELRAVLELPLDRTTFSWQELMEHGPLQHQIAALEHRSRRGRKDPLESKVTDIRERLMQLSQVFNNRAIRLLPEPESALAAWRTIPLNEPGPATELSPASAAWLELKSAFLADDAPAFTTAAGRLVEALNTLPAAYRPSADLLAMELRYNQLRPYRLAWRIMAAGALLAALALVLRHRSLDLAAFVALFGGFAVLSYGMWLRWTIAGRLPASNMFESLLFLSWGMGVFAMISLLVMRDRRVTLSASFLGALALFLADVLPLDRYIRPIAPVLLDTYWMSIHVPVIMVSYSVLAMAALVAHAQIILLAVAPGREEAARKVDAIHYWYVHVGCLLLAVGIMTGSMWAASSWGRYWGWDPKEVWSLIALLGYLAAMHVRVDPDTTPRWVYGLGAVLAAAVLGVVCIRLAPLSRMEALTLAASVLAGLIFLFARGMMATCFKSILAFWLIIMTYVGVNFVLGTGLHSYGFGTGAVVRYLTLIGSLDLAFVALLAGVYLLRRPRPAMGAG